MHFILFFVLYALYYMHCIQCIVFYELYFMHCIVGIVCYALYSMHCFLCIVLCALHFIHFLRCIVCYKFYSMHFILHALLSMHVELTLKLVVDRPTDRRTLSRIELLSQLKNTHLALDSGSVTGCHLLTLLKININQLDFI